MRVAKRHPGPEAQSAREINMARGAKPACLVDLSTVSAQLPVDLLFINVAMPYSYIGNYSRSARLRGRPVKRSYAGLPIRVPTYGRLANGMMSAAGKRRMYRKRVAGGTIAGTSRVRTTRALRDFPIFAPPFQAARQEMKYVDVAIAAGALDTTGSVTFLNNISVGSTLSTRADCAIRLLGCVTKGNVQSKSATTVAAGAWMIVYDRAPSPYLTPVLPAVTDILETATTAAFQVVDGRNRFQILCRFDYSFIGNNTTPTNQSAFRSVNEKLDFNLPARYEEAGGGTLTSITTGALYLLCIGDTAAGTGAATANLTIRVLFADA